MFSNDEIKNINLHIKRHGKDKKIQEIENAIIEKGDASDICYFAKCVKGADVKTLQDAVIKIGNARYIWAFARDVKGADINLLQNELLKVGTANDFCNFASVKGADIKALQDAVIKSGNAKYIYLFACDVKGADIKALQKALIETGNEVYTYLFARRVKGADVDLLLNTWLKVMKIDSYNSASMKSKFGKVLQDLVIKSGNAEYIYHLARINGVDKIKSQEVLFKDGSLTLQDCFVNNVKDLYEKKLQDLVIKSGNAEYICKFAWDIEGADRDALGNAIYKTGDSKYIAIFVNNFNVWEIESREEQLNTIEKKL